MNARHHQAGAVRARFTSGFLLIRNVAFTIGADGLISVMALFAVPILVNRLGTARFGVLALAWIIIGYASILDLGLGRALTRVTADRLGTGRPHDVPRLFWTTISMLVPLGAGIGLIIVALSGPLANDLLAIESGLTAEAQATFILLGCTVPFVLVSAALRGSLEAHLRFDLTNGVAVPLSFLSYFGPVGIALFTSNLALVVLSVCVSRFIATTTLLYLCLRVDPALRKTRIVDRSLIGPLLRYGGWVTVAAIVTGVMLTVDRFVIGATVSATAVAFYATPYEGARQMLVVSGAFASVLFPGFSAHVRTDRAQTEKLFSRGVRATFVGLFPLALIASVLSYEILDIWINHEFATNGGPVLQLLAVGVLINGLAFVAFALIQSIRPALIALIAGVELVFYVGVLWLLLHVDGIRGAAIAFALRALVDTAALFIATNRLQLIRGVVLFAVLRMTVAGLAAIGIGTLMPDAATRLAYVAIVLVCFMPISWLRILTREERQRIREKLAQLRETIRSKRLAADVA